MHDIKEKTRRLMDLLGHDEETFGVCYEDAKPDGFGPKLGEVFTREREAAGLIDWRNAWKTFSCILGNIWLARKKKKAAWLSHSACGCMGGGFYAGLYRPCLDMNILYVTIGMPEAGMEGEHYLPSTACMEMFMEAVMPPEATGRFCVFRPLEQFTDANPPLVVNFFGRPEVLSGLYSLTMYATGDHNAVATPFSSACGALLAWPLVYQQRGEEKAVLGGFDLSARKYMKTDELTFSVPLPLYRKMLDVMEDSALTRKVWRNARKKVSRSINTWAGK